MLARIEPRPLAGTIPAIPSKSHVHRLLLAAAAADRPTLIRCAAFSADMDATARCLPALGASALRTAEGYLVTPGAAGTADPTVDCGESGTTFRLLLPMTCALGKSVQFLRAGRLPSRPLSPLYEELTAHGCTLSAQSADPFSCAGQLRGGAYTLAGNVSSQFISGLLFALPLAAEDSVLHLTGTVSSASYIELTLQVLRLFGIEIHAVPGGYAIPGGQRFRSPGTVTAEGDWSNAAFWLCAGALAGSGVTVTGLRMDTVQGDSACAALLQRFGAHITVSGDAVTAAPGPLRAVDIDADAIPDLAPVLSLVAAAAAGESRIYNAGRLRYKESDRLATTAALLTALGGRVREEADALVISGKPGLAGGICSAAGDHRIAMTAAVAAAVCAGPVTIQGAQAVSKSYPTFFDDFNRLGGKAGLQ